MNEVLDRSGAVVTNRELQPTTDRAGPTTPTPTPTPPPLEFDAYTSTTSNTTRKLRIARYTIVGVREDAPQRVTLFTTMAGLPSVQVSGTFGQFSNLVS